MKKNLTICVFCGSRLGNDPAFLRAAENLGTFIGQRGFDLVFGGGNAGLMGAVSQAALKAGAYVTGVIPEILMESEKPKSNLSNLMVVKTMHDRKRIMTEIGDLFIALPGGVGTMEEVFEVLTGNWIGAYKKPVGFLDVNNYYESLFRFLQDANKTAIIPDRCLELIHKGTDPEGLIQKLLEAKDQTV